MNSRLKSHLLSGALALLPLTFIAPTFAAQTSAHPQPGGILASIVILMLVGGYTLSNIPLQVMFYFNGQYQSRRCISWHSTVGVIIALIGAAFAIYDHHDTGELMFYFGVVLVAIAIACVPFLLKSSTKVASANAGRNLLILSGCYLVLAIALSLLVTPFAIVLALIAGYWQTNKTTVFNAGRWLLVIISIAWFIYQLTDIYQMIMHH